MTATPTIQEILLKLLEEDCDPSTLGNLELAIAWDFLHSRVRTQTPYPEPTVAVANILSDLLDNACNTDKLELSELDQVWNLLENKRIRRQQNTEPMQ